MTNRRDFLKTSGLLTTALSIGIFPKCTSKNIKEPGLILGTVKDQLKKDYKGTLKIIADTGYKYIEGIAADIPLEQFGKDLYALGLIPVASGSSIYQLQTSLDSYISDAKKLNQEYLVCYWPWLDGADNLTLDEFKACAKRLNDVGEKCADAGLKFAFHNHDKEFKNFDGTIGMDVILENTKPEWVTVELDLYWIIKAGYKPTKYFEKYPGRYELFHVKDMDHTQERERTCVGDGIIDFVEIFQKADQAGVKYYIVEQEAAKPETQIECIKTSYQHLTNLDY